MDRHAANGLSDGALGVQPKRHVFFVVEAITDTHGAALNAEGFETRVAIQRLRTRVFGVHAKMNLQYACSTRVRNGGVQQAAGNAAAPMCRVNKHAPQHGLVRDLRKRFTPQAGNTDQLRPGKSTQHLSLIHI